MSRSILPTLILALVLAPFAAADFDDQQVFTEFSFNDPGPFDITTDPPSAVSATFSGDAFAGVAGIGELYRSGFQAWMVNPQGTGEVDFNINATVVQFYARIRTGADGGTVITAFEDDNSIIDTIELLTTDANSFSFQLYEFTGDIDRITFVNNATDAGDFMNAVEDFGFSVPEPASLGLVMLGACGIAARRRKHHPV